MTSSSLSVPPELVLQIVGHVSSTDKTTLARCALVCRWLLADTAPRLYRDVVLDGQLKIEQLFGPRIDSITLTAPATPEPEPQGIDLSRLGPVAARGAAPFPRSVHLVAGSVPHLSPTLLDLLNPHHVTISRGPHDPQTVSMYFPMFCQLDATGAMDDAMRRWTALQTIELVDCYPLSSGAIFLGRFVFEPVLFNAPIAITFDFTSAGPVTGLEDVHLQFLFMNCLTKGMLEVSELKKLVVKVGSEPHRRAVEAGRSMVGGFTVVDEAEVVLIGSEGL